MIIGKEQLNFDYYSKYMHYGESINLNEPEKLLIERYFREKLRILPEQKINFDSPEVLMMVDLFRFTGYLS